MVSRNTTLKIAASRGFTLVEVMVVVVILGILATLVLPRVIGNTDQARQTAAQQDIRAMEMALNLYRLDNYKYPTTDQGLNALVNAPDSDMRNYKKGGYIDRARTDPWQNPYQYIYPGQNGEFDLFSYGADGRPGGEGMDADIGNWNMDEI